jgi:TPR repeat protein
MRPLPLTLLACLFAVSPFAAAQTLDEAKQALEKKDYEKARVILEKLAMKNDAEAEFRLAEMYVRPIGIPRNTVRGLALYESAANKSHPEALYAFATELIKGELMPPDKQRAMGYLSTSAKLKNPRAQHALCVEKSTEGGKFYDAEDAYAWCEAAASKKHKDAGDAGKRAKDALKKIESAKGKPGVDAAKARASRYIKDY